LRRFRQLISMQTQPLLTFKHFIPKLSLFPTLFAFNHVAPTPIDLCHIYRGVVVDPTPLCLGVLHMLCTVSNSIIFHIYSKDFFFILIHNDISQTLLSFLQLSHYQLLKTSFQNYRFF